MRIKVKVNTNSSREEVIKISDSEYQVKFKAVREKGKANEKLIAILSKYFKVRKNQVDIVGGKTSSLKHIEIDS